MLSQLSQTSKRFGKLKKYKSKLQQSGFQFLLQSLDRGKENYVPNAQLDNQLIHSVQIDPLLTAPVHSSTLNSSTIIQNSKKSNFFLQNVKILDKSDASISDTCGQNNSKKSKKHRGNSNRSKNVSKKEYRESNQLQSDNSGKVQKSCLEQLINKTKQYMTIFNESKNREDFNVLKKKSKKAQKIQSELIALITNIEEQQLQPRKQAKLSSSINTTKFSLCFGESSKVTKGNQEQYLKKISSLQYQKEKLHSLISQHEIANIKMFVKINEGESEEIQLYKKQLALLFEKYKKLQSIILSDKRKMNEIIKQKQSFQLKNKELTLQNSQLIKNTRQQQRQSSKRQSTLLQAPKHKKNGNLSSLQPHISHSRQKSSQSIFQSSINDRGELYLQSIINSDFQSDNGFGSSITTYTSRMPDRGTKISFNLTSIFQSMKNEKFSKLIEDPSKIKKMLNECRSSIVSLQNVINQQNKQLEFCFTALQENNQKLNENQFLIKSLQSKIVNLTKSLQNQRQKTQQRFKDKLRMQQLQADRKRSFNQIKLMKNSVCYEEKELKKKNSLDDNNKTKIDFHLSRIETDQYRIIALQAKALERILGNQNGFVNQ